LFRLTDTVYLFGALALGTIFVAAAVLFSRQMTRPRARQLFFTSISLPAPAAGADGV